MPVWFCDYCGTGPLHSEVELKCVACNIGQYSASFRGPKLSAPEHATFTHPTTTQSTTAAIYHSAPTSSSDITASYTRDYNHKHGHAVIQTGSHTHGAPVEGETEYRWECHRCGYDNSWDLNPCCMEENCGHWVEGCKKCVVYVNNRKRYTIEDVQ